MDRESDTIGRELPPSKILTGHKADNFLVKRPTRPVVRALIDGKILARRIDVDYIVAANHKGVIETLDRALLGALGDRECHHHFLALGDLANFRVTPVKRQRARLAVDGALHFAGLTH